MIGRALVDYYRCPAEFVTMSLAGELSADSGYFRFGPNICYGQSSSGARASGPGDGLYDALSAVTTDEGLLRLPFDPSQVVDNLRLERYAADPRGIESLRQTFWQRPYYALRRFMPAPLRRVLQRTYLRDWKAHSFPRWPVDNTVDQILEHLLLLSLRSRGIDRLPFVWFWPDGAPSGAIVTHDVETSVGRDRCSWLMDLDDSFGIKASFQIVPEERYSVSPAFLDGIKRRGFEINLHDLNHLLAGSPPLPRRRSGRTSSSTCQRCTVRTLKPSTAQACFCRAPADRASVNNVTACWRSWSGII